MNTEKLSIGRFCYDYRKNILELTLDDMEKETGVPLKTLSGFENGRSSNMGIVFKYLTLSKDVNNRMFFLNKLYEIIERGENNG